MLPNSETMKTFTRSNRNSPCVRLGEPPRPGRGDPGFRAPGEEQRSGAAHVEGEPGGRRLPGAALVPQPDPWNSQRPTGV